MYIVRTTKPVRKCAAILQATRVDTSTYVELPELSQAPTQLRHVTAQTLNTNITNITP
jgi:hypothetical protein